MARKNTVTTTKLAIIQVAVRMFMERGYSNTSARAISAELGISTGNLTFHFPTKDHLLAILVEMLCDFQWQMMKRAVDEGNSSLMAACLELVAMAAICEESEIVKDFYISAYTSPITLEIIRRNDAIKAKQVFGEYCGGWTEEQFVEAETLVSGIEYATLMTTPDAASIDIRIAGALRQIMSLYRVPEEIREMKIKKVLALDYSSIGRRILREFMEYIDQASEQGLEL